LTAIDRRIAADLARLAVAGLTRRPPEIRERRGVRYRLAGRDVIGLCSNDYLGLADEIRADTTRAGAGASRLISGDLDEHRDIERALAELAGTADAVLFPSGYQLNVGVLPALVRRDDIACSDALNHASLIDGLRLGRANVDVLAHGASPDTRMPPGGDAMLWWITESIFSMDGDLADLDAMRRHLARDAALYVDEAHAFGLYAGGRGRLAQHGIVPTAIVGTLGKAYGVAGAFVGASAAACEWIRSRARSFVFSTGTSPALVAHISAALERVRGADGDARRARLWHAANHLAHRLGLDDAPSPIFPIVIGDNDTTSSIALALLDRGWHVQPIRPPTVPVGTSRLRITLSADHEPAMIDAFVDDLRRVLDAANVPLAVERGLVSPVRAGTSP
jgi:7-keto-8-aminopelargonate synthetase-like enzyme